MLSNLVAKLMALAMAIALWLYAYNFSLVRDTKVFVPVKVETVEGWSEKGVIPSRVEVDLRFPRRFRERVDQALKNAVIKPPVTPDERGSDTQPFRIVLSQSHLDVPSNLGIQIVGFTPAEVEVKFTREMAISLPVSLKLSDPPSGYEVSDKSTTPRRVTVRGPKDVMTRAEFIETEEIDISLPPPYPPPKDWSPAEYTAMLVPRVLLDGEEYRVAIVGNPEVRFRIRLSQEAEVRTFPDVPIRVSIPVDYPYDVELDEGQRSTTVTVSGPSDLIERLKPENIDLYVNVAKLEPAEARHSPPIRVNIVDMTRSGELVVKLGITTCAVKISEPPETAE